MAGDFNFDDDDFGWKDTSDQGTEFSNTDDYGWGEDPFQSSPPPKEDEDEFGWGEDPFQSSTSAEKSADEDEFGWGEDPFQSSPPPKEDEDEEFGWGSTPTPSSDTTSEQVWGMDKQDSDSWDGQSVSLPGQAPVIPKKLIGVVLGVLVLVIALVVLFIDSIKVKPKEKQSVINQTQQSQQTHADQGSSHSVQLSSDELYLISIPDSTVLNYDGEVQQVSGVVSAKEKFLQDHQVVYCITVDVVFGTITEHMKSWCNYNTFSAVSVGETVQLKYQQVEDGYISVIEISK